MTPKLLSVLVAVFTLLAFGPGASAQIKIAVVDMGKVFEGYHKTKTATDLLKQQGADMDKEMSALTAEYQKAVEEYKTAQDEASNQSISPAEREKRKKEAELKFREAQDKEQAIKQFRAQANTKMGEDERRMRDNIVKEIRAVINAKAKIVGYSLVLDTAGLSASAVPLVLYHNGQNDITEEILTQLNATAPVGTANGKK